MKTSEKPDHQTALTKPLRTQRAGLYGEVGVLPISRAGPAGRVEPKTIL